MGSRVAQRYTMTYGVHQGQYSSLFHHYILGRGIHRGPVVISMSSHAEKFEMVDAMDIKTNKWTDSGSYI